MMDKFLYSSLRIFIWITVGVVVRIIFNYLKLSKIKTVLKYTAEIIVIFIVPYFVGVRVWLYGIDKTTLILTITWFVITILISYSGSKFLTTRFGYSFKEVFLPLTFTNSLYLGVPVTEYFISPNAVYYTIIYAIVATLIQFTFGVYLISSSSALIKIVLSSPVIYFFLSGWLLNIYKVQVPAVIQYITHILSSVVSPVMLIFVGYSLQWRYIFDKIRFHIFVNLFRMLIMFIASVIFSIIVYKTLGVNKEFIKVIVLVSILPSAIANHVLTEKFGINLDFVCGELFWGTVLILLLLPYFAEVLEIILLFVTS